MKKFYACTQCDHVLTDDEEFCPDHPDPTVEGPIAEGNPTKNITIRIPIGLWKELRDAVTSGKIESISAAALQGMRDAVQK